jgi:predicted secreted hydrolase
MAVSEGQPTHNAAMSMRSAFPSTASLDRRRALLALGAVAIQPSLAQSQPEVLPPLPGLQFPRDHGAHLDARTEWWYVTGQLQSPVWKAPVGFQITFFRSRIEPAQSNPSALAAKHLVMAHVALSNPSQKRQWHEQRLARSGLGLVDTSSTDTKVHLRDWALSRQGAAEGSVYTAQIAAADFHLDLRLRSTQAVMPQGQDGISHKGPQADHFSHYYSQPQLSVQGQCALGLVGQRNAVAVQGRAWLDHEWSDAYLPTGAVGWDWIGMNLTDGSALMAFRMRRADGSTLWAGGSWRAPGRAVQPFAASEVRFMPGRTWQSPATGARYPVQWALQTPAGRFEVLAIFDAQELDAKRSTGTVYWEGMSRLLDARGQEVGTGYLEMTGYAGPLSI